MSYRPFDLPQSREERQENFLNLATLALLAVNYLTVSQTPSITTPKPITR